MIRIYLYNKSNTISNLHDTPLIITDAAFQGSDERTPAVRLKDD
ncbi:hypothetical protein [Paenisporosarcina sp. OV554]|nr:hypothetical protein [Paenisporosarcina sp. OV554]